MSSEFVSSKHLPRKFFHVYIINKNGLLTKCEVKMAGYWPSSFFACLWTFESSFFIVLAIIIRRLLYGLDYEVSSLNSS